MSGGGGSKSKSKSGFAQNWAQPHAESGMASVESVYNANAPGLQGMTNLIQNQIVPGAFGKYQSSLAGANAAQGYNMDILGGKFMDGNPYLQQMIDRSRGDIMDDVGGMFARSGRYGSGAHQDLLVDGLADMESQYRFNNYSQEMARRDAASAALAENNRQDLNQTLGSIGMGAELPYTGIQNLANSLNALSQGSYDRSKQKGPGLGSQLLSAGASIGSAALMACMRELKTNIELIRREKDGMGWYRFAYKRAPKIMLEGPMADEVARFRPWALGPVINGIQTVNMAAL